MKTLNAYIQLHIYVYQTNGNGLAYLVLQKQLTSNLISLMKLLTQLIPLTV